MTVMKAKDFFRKFASLYLWGNLLAMAVVIVLLAMGVKYGLEIYTRHDEGIPVPNITNMDFSKAQSLLEMDGLYIEVSDSGYNKRMPANCILAQTPGYGTKVKQGRTIYVTVNSPSSPTVSVPDIIDNCSRREAEAKLTALGFRLLEPRYVAGEKDWVLGLVSRGRDVAAGDRISTDYPVMLKLGNGAYDNSYDDLNYVDSEYPTEDETVGEYNDGDNTGGGADDFEVVTGPE